MKRKMSERQAWLWLAKRWAKAKADRDGGYYKADIGDLRVNGLCTGVNEMVWLDMIDNDTREQMLAKIDSVQMRHGVLGLYAWPLTAAGARARVRFCERQAAKLDKRKKGKVGT